jgi:cellulose biosynthesis protein BcsQ
MVLSTDPVLRGAAIKSTQKTEIIAFCSGKGGTGKTLTCSCLGYALTRGGQNVLMIDGDPGTDGLSLFLLGQKGQEQVASFGVENTFIGALGSFKEGSPRPFEPRLIHRRGEDHGVSYNAVISGKGLYGEEQDLTAQLAVPDLDRATFRNAIRYLFEELRNSSEYSYILVDTRGGFAFESTDICALADSFIVVTEPDFTSFYQDRNLVARISHAAKELDSPSLLRGIIVNKATDTLHRPGEPSLDDVEVSFRNELVREFPIKFHETYPIPVDIDALLAYKIQRIPYTSTPGSPFTFATLAAFSDILRIVTSRWSIQQVDKWNELVEIVSAGARERRKQEELREQERAKHEDEWKETQSKLRESQDKITLLERELAQQESRSDKELERTKLLIDSSVASSESRYAEYLKLANQQSAARARNLTMLLGFVIILAAVVIALLYMQYRKAVSEAEKQAQSSRELLDQQPRHQPEINQPSTSPGSTPARAGAANDDKNSQAGWVAPGDSVSGNFAVLLSDDQSLQPAAAEQPSGIYEADLVHRLGYTSVSMYQNQGLYSTAVLFDSLAKAQAAEKDLKTQFGDRWRRAYVVTLSAWCPLKMPSPESPQVVQGFQVPVWQCTGIAPAANAAPTPKGIKKD